MGARECREVVSLLSSVGRSVSATTLAIVVVGGAFRSSAKRFDQQFKFNIAECIPLALE